MFKILVTSVGSLVGYNILDVLEGRRQGLRLIGTNSVASDSNVFRCDEAYFVPPSRQKPEFIRLLLEILEREKPDFIIPCRDDDLSVLAALRKYKTEFAYCCLCGSEKSVEIITDKWLTYKFASAHDLPFAASAIPTTASENSEVKRLLAKFGFPLLVKPRHGFGSNGVFIISNEGQFKRVLGMDNIVIQQYLGDTTELDRYHHKLRDEGTPLFFSFEEKKYSLQTFVYRDGSVGEIFCTLHKMLSGRSLKVEKITNDALENIALRYANALASEGWFGPLNIQCQRQQSGEFIAYELNGRFTGATSARYHLGFDEVGNTLNTLFGLHLKSKRSNTSSSQVSRYVTTLPIPDDAEITFRDQDAWRSISTKELIAKNIGSA